MVNILASVRDKHNGLVANLNKDDFTLFEDGKQQTIKYFTKETDLPLTIGLLVDVSGEPAQSDRDRTQRRLAVLLFGAAQEGRGVPDQLRRRGGAAAGLHAVAAAAERGAEPAAGELGRQRNPSRDRCRRPASRAARCSTTRSTWRRRIS